MEALPEDQKATTLGGHRDVLAKFGMELRTPMSAEAAAMKADFAVFMEQYGMHGLALAESYEMEGLPDAPPRCDHCGKVGATERCKKCGEWYCSQECQRAAWRAHWRICKMVSG